MARRSKMSFQKRQREKKKAEKAALKRDERSRREKEPREGGGTVATPDDLADYGFPSGDDEGEAEPPDEPRR